MLQCPVSILQTEQFQGNIEPMDKNAFGNLVREARDRYGLRSYELAAKMGKQPSFLSRIETGTMKDTPSPEVLALLHEHLGLSEVEMLKALGYLQGEPPSVEARPPSRLRDRLHAAVDAVDWDRATNMAKTLLEIMAAQRHDQEHPRAAVTTPQPVPETVQGR